MNRNAEPGFQYIVPTTPPPGPPVDPSACDAQAGAEGTFLPLARWDPGNWPSHIHSSKKERSP